MPSVPAEDPGKMSNMAILVAVVAVSFSAIFIKWSNAHPFVIAFYRMGITSLMLLPFVLLRYRDEIRAIGRRDLLTMVGIGAILSIHFATWITSLSQTSVASSVILVTSHPLFVAIVSYYIFKEGLRIIGYIGILVAFSGIIVLSLGDYSIGNQNLIGDMLALIGAFAAGIYILGGRKLRRKVSLVPYVFLVYSICTIFLLSYCLAASAPLHPLPAREYGLFLLMAIIPTIFGHTLYNWALKYVKAQVVSVSLLGEPIGASILAFMLIPGEIPTEFTFIGGALVLTGIYITYSSRNEKTQQ